MSSRQALEVLRTQSLTQVIRRELERMILSGELKGGEKLNENELVRRLAVSRGPIREAFRSLEEAGLVTVVVNRGVFVRKPSLKEALDVYDIRASLAGLACRTLAGRITDAQVEVLTDLVARMEKGKTSRDIDAYYPLNLEFHARIMEFCGNERLAAMYQACVKELHLFRRQSLVMGGGLEVSNQEHRRVLQALKARDANRAGRLMEKHILAGKQRFVKASGG